MNNKTSTLAERLSMSIENKNIRQTDLAEAVGVSKVRIHYYVTGKNEPSFDVIRKLADVLNVNEAWLAGYDAPMERVTQSKSTTISVFTEMCRDNPLVYDCVKSIMKLDDRQLRLAREALVYFSGIDLDEDTKKETIL